MLRRDKQRMTMDMRSWWVDGGDDPNGHHDLSTLSLSHDEVFSLPCLGETCLQKAQKPSSISWFELLVNAYLRTIQREFTKTSSATNYRQPQALR